MQSQPNQHQTGVAGKTDQNRNRPALEECRVIHPYLTAWACLLHLGYALLLLWSTVGYCYGKCLHVVVPEGGKGMSVKSHFTLFLKAHPPLPLTETSHPIILNF